MQLIFIVECDTLEKARSAATTYMQRTNNVYPIAYREHDAVSKEELGNIIASTENGYGAYVYTSNDHDSAPSASRKRKCGTTMFYGVVYAPAPP